MKPKDLNIKNTRLPKKWLTLTEAASYLCEEYGMQADEKDILHLISIGSVEGFVFTDQDVAYDLFAIVEDDYCGKGFFYGLVPIEPRDARRVEAKGFARITGAKNPHETNETTIVEYEPITYFADYKKNGGRNVDDTYDAFQWHLEESLLVTVADLVVDTPSLQAYMEKQTTEASGKNSALLDKKVVDRSERDIAPKAHNSYLRLIYALSSALINGGTERKHTNAEAVLAQLANAGVESPIKKDALARYLDQGKKLMEVEK